MIIWRHLVTETFSLEPENYHPKVIVIDIYTFQPPIWCVKAAKDGIHNQMSNRMSIKKKTFCLYNTSLKRTKWSTVLKQLSLDQLQKLVMG